MPLLQADELPMIYGTLVFIYCVVEHGNRTPKHPMLLPLLFLVAAAISALSVFAAPLPSTMLRLIVAL
jgi:hypothetical protein